MELHADLFEEFDFLGNDSENLFPSVFFAIYLTWYFCFFKNKKLIALGFIFDKLFTTNYSDISFVLTFLHA